MTFCYDLFDALLEYRTLNIVTSRQFKILCWCGESERIKIYKMIENVKSNESWSMHLVSTSSKVYPLYIYANESDQAWICGMSRERGVFICARYIHVSNILYTAVTCMQTFNCLQTWFLPFLIYIHSIQLFSIHLFILIVIEKLEGSNGEQPTFFSKTVVRKFAIRLKFTDLCWCVYSRAIPYLHKFKIRFDR